MLAEFLCAAVGVAFAAAPSTAQASILVADFDPAERVETQPGPLSPGRLAASATQARHGLPMLPGAGVDDGGGDHGIRSSLLLTGLALVGAGLVLGGTGFAILYFCAEGTACYSSSTRTIGWILAAPGLVPLVVGLVLVYITVGGRGRVHGAIPVAAASRRPRWAIAPTFLPSGGGVGAAMTF